MGLYGNLFMMPQGSTEYIKILENRLLEVAPTILATIFLCGLEL